MRLGISENTQISSLKTGWLVLPPRGDDCILLNQDEHYLLIQMYKPQTKESLITKYYQHTGKYLPNLVESNIRSWMKLGIIHSDHKVRHAMDVYLQLDKLVETEIHWRHIGTLVNVIYSLLLKRALIRNLFLFASGVTVISSVVILLLTGMPAHPEFSLLSFLIITWICLSLHEIGHGVVARCLGLPVTRAGFQIFFGLPVLYVDTSAVWARDRLQRVLTAAGGMIVNLLLISFSIVLSAIFPAISSLLAIILFINFSQIIISLIPFARMDGYFILTDILKHPNLELEADEAMKKLIHRRVKMKDAGLILYFVFNFAATILLALYAYAFWHSLTLAA